MVTVHHPHFGLIEWELPPTLHARMLQSRRTDTEAAVTSQVRDVLSLVATALVDVAGDRRRATRLSHVLNELIYVSRDVTPPKKRKRKCDH
jgi:hypothetical protein